MSWKFWEEQRLENHFVENDVWDHAIILIKFFIIFQRMCNNQQNGIWATRNSCCPVLCLFYVCYSIASAARLTVNPMQPFVGNDGAVQTGPMVNFSLAQVALSFFKWCSLLNVWVKEKGGEVTLLLMSSKTHKKQKSVLNSHNFNFIDPQLSYLKLPEHALAKPLYFSTIN